MPISLEELLEQIPSDTEERVKRARDRFNALVREALRRETGLRIKRSGSGETTTTAREDVTVRIALVPGLPVPLMGRMIEDRYRLAALLAPWKHTLERLRDSSRDIAKGLFPILLVETEWSSLLGNRQVHLARVDELAEDLLKEIAKFDLAKWIFEVNEDVLGIYFHRQRSSLFGEVYGGYIELYWAVIGLVAQVIGTSVEALAVAVLAHELAHAYTHFGTDIHGHRWQTDAFVKADRPLTEGLAQYYTAMVCRRFERREIDALDAYTKLLPHQPPPYHPQEKWLEEFDPEQIRAALIEMRRNGTGKITDFGNILRTAKQRLRVQS